MKANSVPTAGVEERGRATIPEAERYLGVSRASLYRLMETGQLAYTKLGRCRRIPWAALRQIVERSLVRA